MIWIKEIITISQLYKEITSYKTNKEIVAPKI